MYLFVGTLGSTYSLIGKKKKNQGSRGQGDDFQSGTVLRYSGTLCLNLVSELEMW